MRYKAAIIRPKDKQIALTDPAKESKKLLSDDVTGLEERDVLKRFGLVETFVVFVMVVLKSFKSSSSSGFSAK